MKSLNDYLFGPLKKEYCLYFYLLSVIGFFLAVLIFLVMMWAIFSDSRKQNMTYVFAMSYGILWLLLFYLQNRILHTMCSQNNMGTPAK